MTSSEPSVTIPMRQGWMAVLARSSRADLEELVRSWDPSQGPLPEYEILKAPETGTLMIEARAGGAGRRFNAGEATMTRCVVRLATGETGFSYALGRDRRKAESAALIEALLQRQGPAGPLGQAVASLAARQAAARALASRKAAATKVEFFTLVRGE